MRSKKRKIQTTLKSAGRALIRADFSLKSPLAVTLDLKCESGMLLEGLKQSHTGSKMINLRNYMVLKFRALYGSVFQGSDFYCFSPENSSAPQSASQSIFDSSFDSSLGCSFDPSLGCSLHYS